MEVLILAINKLQDVFAAVNSPESIELPQIVVIGSQSTGKSSVIESLVKKNFLPRGTGIVTRRPLVLQLINCPLDDSKYRSEANGTSAFEEWGEFLHKPDKIFSDFDAIRQEIEDDTNLLAGSNKGIFPEPINLRIFSHKVVNLTLVDLPGITKVPVGDQPKDIENQVEKLIFSFIKNPNSIILVVSAANVDMATCESLKFATQVDPDGSRTLAVLTKLDLMDQGTDANEVLKGDVITVKLGIIGVVNRSQQSITDKKNIEDQLDMEMEFLKTNYREIAEVNGTPYLEKTLSQLLMRHIHKCLPNLKKRVYEETRKYEEKIEAYGKDVNDNNEAIVHVLMMFVEAYNATIEGIPASSKNGTTQLYEILHENFSDSIDEVDPCKKRTKLSQESDVATLSSGKSLRPTLFNTPIFDEPFERIVTEYIKLLKDPSHSCNEKVSKDLQRMVKNCGSKVHHEMQRFPKLQKKIVESTNQLIKSRTEMATDMINNLINFETAYINKKHPDFNNIAALSLLDPQPGTLQIRRFPLWAKSGQSRKSKRFLMA